jgi:signal transduction histidine kinase
LRYICAVGEPVEILVVDDLPDKRLAFEALLAPLGQRLTLVDSGTEALRRVLAQKFDILVLDVNIPDMDGLELARLIREHKRYRDTPILFVSALDDPRRIVRAYSLGAVDYIADPSVPGVVRSKLKVFIDLIQAQRQAAALERERLSALAAQEANRRKDDFIATLSHELRNPLAPLRNVVHLLRKRFAEEPTIDTACGVLERQVKRMTVLIDDLSDVARITQGKIRLERVRIDLREVLSTSVESTQPLVAQRRQTLSVDIGNEPLWVEGDAVRLAQVFSNLLTNASKYTPEQGAIWLEAKSVARQAVIAVRDNGVGVEPEMLTRVFDLFVQSERSVVHRQGGLGIGLALVKELVQMHDGRVELASEGVGKGTVVRVRLPLREEGVERVPPVARAAAAFDQQPTLH